MQLNPGENFVITHQIGDHTDPGTYYVRAVIRNGITDVTIATVNLVDRGDLRFSNEWQVPQDPSGQGFYISITTTVYTDSGYTAKSALYSEEQERHLVQLRMNPNLGYGGGSGGSSVDIDYKKVRKIIAEEMDKIVFPEQKETQPIVIPKTDLSPVRSDIVALNASIKVISDIIASMPRFEKTEINFDSMESGISELNSSISGLKESLEEIEEVMEKSFESHGKGVSEMMIENINAIKSDIETLAGKIEDMQGGTISLDLSSLPDIKQKKEKKESEKTQQGMPDDIAGIMRRSFIRRNKTRKV